MNKTYVVISGNPSDTEWEAAIETADTARWSLDKTQVILKFDGETPPAFIGHTLFTHAEMMHYLDFHSDKWQPDDL